MKERKEKKKKEFLYFVAIHFSLNRTLVRMIFRVLCYCNWVFWIRKETAFTEMCKFVAELTVKMRTPKCFFIWLVSKDVWAVMNCLIAKGEPRFSLGMVRIRLCECASQKWAANAGGRCCPFPGCGFRPWPEPSSILSCFLLWKQNLEKEPSISFQWEANQNHRKELQL